MTTLYLHVGASKTGTTSLQFSLRRSREALVGAGVQHLLPERTNALRRLLRPLGWTADEGFVGEVDHEALAWLGRRVASIDAETVLLSCEDLAELDPMRIAALKTALAAADVTIVPVVMARSWAKQLPSDYQQFLQVGWTATFEEFLAGVRDRSAGFPDRFRARQHFAEIAERWVTGLDADPAIVLSVPSFATDPDGLRQLFATILGVDDSVLTPVRGSLNPSFGSIEVELLRRINVSAADAVTGSYKEGYQPVIRHGIVRGALPRAASAKLKLPAGDLAWVQDVDRGSLAALETAGARFVGDPTTLVSEESDAAREPQVVGSDDVADAAVRLLTAFAVEVHAEKATGKAGNQAGQAEDS